MATHELVPLGFPVRRSQPAPYGTRARVGLARGDIEGGFALTGVDRRAGTAIYALRIANQSGTPLRARMECTRSRSAPVLAYPLDVHVAPFAIAETILPVRLAEVGPFDRALVKVSGADVAFTLEAPAPPRRRPRRWLAAGVAIATIFGGAFGAATATPHLDILAAPARAFAGAPLDVPYAFRGWSSLRYSLQTKDGRQLAAGLLTQRQGTLHFALPRNAGSEVVLAASLAGPLGGAQVSRHIAITAGIPVKLSPAAPRIDEFAIVSTQIRAGEPLQVRYATNARAGDVWLIDSTGRLWATAPISPAGVSELKIPLAAAGMKMRVVLHARNGSADTTSTISALVLPSKVLADTTPAPNAQSQVLSISLSSDQVAPGDEVIVTVNGVHGDTRVSLTDSAGNSVEQGDLPAGQSAVSLSAPTVTSATTYYVVANVTSGVSEQSLVKKLIVTPR